MPPGSATALTIAVIHHHVRGYPADCLESLIAGAPYGTELLLVHGQGQPIAAAPERFPGTRTICLEAGDRAAAKNLAISEARGELLLLVTSDTVAAQGAVETLFDFLRRSPDTTLAAAQLLLENGMQRVSAWRFPTLWQQISPFARIRQLAHTLYPMRKPAPPGPPRLVDAVPATFIMAHRRLFNQVGPFVSGYRFFCEDIEWCWRAHREGARIYIVPAARAYKLAPQLKGALEPNVRLAMENSIRRLMANTRSPTYARLFSLLRCAKSLSKWLTAAGLNALVGGRSALLLNAASVHSALSRACAKGFPLDNVPDDIESLVRWEATLLRPGPRMRLRR